MNNGNYMEDKKFASGFLIRPPREGAPDFVKAAISIKVQDFVAFLKENIKEDGWVNLDLKKSKEGRLYAQLNDWKPKKQEVSSEDVPF